MKTALFNYLIYFFMKCCWVLGAGFWLFLYPQPELLALSPEPCAYITPISSIEFATLRNPAMLAPFT